MIKLVLEITEENSKAMKGLTATKLEVEHHYKEYEATKGEKEALQFIKDKIGLDGRTEIVNQCSTKFRTYNEFEKMLNKFFEL